MFIALIITSCALQGEPDGVVLNAPQKQDVSDGTVFSEPQEQDEPESAVLNEQQSEPMEVQPQPEHRVMDYAELIDQRTGEIVEVREGDIFEGFYVAELEREQTYHSEDGWWNSLLEIRFEKEITLQGALVQNYNTYGWPGVTYFRIEESDFLRLPLDSGRAIEAVRGHLRILNSSEIFPNVGVEDYLYIRGELTIREYIIIRWETGIVVGVEAISFVES